MDAKPKPTAEFLALLASTVNDVVPAGVRVEPQLAGIWIHLESGGVRIVDVWDDDVTVEEFAAAVLHALQEEVIEEVTKTGWPPADPARPDDPQFGRDLPYSHAELGDGAVACWYGDRDRPALVLPPVPLRSADARERL